MCKYKCFLVKFFKKRIKFVQSKRWAVARTGTLFADLAGKNRTKVNWGRIKIKVSNHKKNKKSREMC